MTTSQIISDLAGISYGTGITNVTRYLVGSDIEFEDFTKFPVVIIETGSETDEPLANLMSRVTFNPALYFITEGETAANMESWRDGIRNAVMNSTTLRGHADTVQVLSITPYLSPERVLQYLKFELEIVFDLQHTA